MRAILAILTAAVLLAACATSTDKSGQPAAGVEERKPGGAKPVESKPIARVEPGGKPSGAGFAALKDPNNILSKRSIFYDYDKFVTCKVVVVRVVESGSPEAEKYPVGFGVRIVEIADESRDKLGAMLDRVSKDGAAY